MRFVYGTKINVPDYIIKGDSTYRVVTDHLGSVRLVVNSQTGNVIQQIEYDEYGIVLSNTNPGFQPFGFAGGMYDTDTKLTRFGARDYSPAAGRWNAKDPINFEGDYLNLYGYAINNPINRIDSDGKFSGTTQLSLLKAGTISAAIAVGEGIVSGDSWEDIAIQGVVGFGLGYFGGAVLQKLSKAVGPVKNWLRIGKSYSRTGNFNTWGIRWGASPVKNGKYLKQIGNPKFRYWNQRFRNLRLPFDNWRTQDPGHLHIFKIE